LGTATSSFPLIHFEFTGFSPTSGPSGTPVTLSGVGFNEATIYSIGFNGWNTANFTIDSDTQITVPVPSPANSGPIYIYTGQGTVQSADSFTVTP
jgi:hypothetical protein